MIADSWYWIVGIPVIVVLAARAWRRTAALKRRITDVQDEMARSPLPPSAMLAQLYQEQETDGKRAD